jgi:hypothetical protein
MDETPPQSPPVVWQASHHKSGTVAVRKVVWSVGISLGWTTLRPVGHHDIYRQLGPFNRPVVDSSIAFTSPTVVLDSHSRIPVPSGSHVKGVHVIRDPRKMILSGVVYHRHTEEEWALLPQVQFGGKSYQQVLRESSDVDAVHREIDNARTTLEAMLDWDYSDTRFRNVRLEVLERSPRAWLELLTFLFPDANLGQKLLPVWRFSKGIQRLRDRFKPHTQRHFSSNLSPRPRWQPEHEEHFDTIFGKRFQRLGYQ